MRCLTPVMTAFCLLCAVDSQATQQWSACQVVVGVNNNLAASNEVIVALSPGIAGCSPNGITGGVKFTMGNPNSINASNVQSFLASSLMAHATGQQVTIFFD